MLKFFKPMPRIDIKWIAVELVSLAVIAVAFTYEPWLAAAVFLISEGQAINGWRLARGLK